MPLESLTLLVIRPGRPRLIVPRLERGAAEEGSEPPVEIRTWDETDDPYALAVDGIARAGSPVAVSDTMLAMHLLRIQRRSAARATYVLASTVLRELRMSKDADEIALLRQGGPRRRPSRRRDRRRPRSSGGPRPTSPARFASG